MESNNDDNDSVNNEKEIIPQTQFYASSVTDFSSQYGAERDPERSSYCVRNIIGPPTIYPNYGDEMQSCVFREYGTWWKTCPMSRVIPSSVQTDSLYFPDQFVDLHFGRGINVERVDIYETYNPGSVVAIWGLCRKSDRSMSWHLYWKSSSGAPTSEPPICRIFSPKLECNNLPMEILRLQLNCSLCEYYTELDAVQVRGKEMYFLADSNNVSYSIREKSTSVNDITKTMQQCQLSNLDDAEEWSSASCPLQILPNGIMFLICKYLTLQDLSRFACTSKFCNYIVNEYLGCCIDSLNLEFAWSTLDDKVLLNLRQIFKSSLTLCHVNLSRCGPYEAISQYGAAAFFENTNFSSRLSTLRLANCLFVTDHLLSVVVSECPNLKVLDLSSARNITSLGFNQLGKLKHLKWLNIYRTCIDDESLKHIVSKCLELSHLNVGACRHVNNMDHVFLEWQKHNPLSLRAVDLWRANVTIKTLKILSESFFNLEELDIGWCSQADFCDSRNLLNLIKHCKKLKKLYLTAFRTVGVVELLAMAKYLQDLEQLDILGSNPQGKDAILEVLNNCRKMKMFDLSFCQIPISEVTQMRLDYPHCAILSSFTT